MKRRFFISRKSLLLGLSSVTTLVLVVVALLEKEALQSWYYVRQLSQAEEDQSQHWAARVAGLDVAALPRLMDCLRRTNRRPCANAQTALGRMVENWEAGDARRTHLADQLAQMFVTLSAPGQKAALEIQDLLLRTSAPAAAEIFTSTTKTLSKAARGVDEAVQQAALKLAGTMLQRDPPDEVLSTCRQLVRNSLRNKAAENRARAIRLALHPGMNLLDSVVFLLGDPVAEVRRAALLAVGPDCSIVNTDDLLCWLHDPDLEVRRLCEKALRGRGLRDEHLRLGRIVTDHRPGTRLQILELLGQATDLEPGVWLRRLSHDAAPAVRAAAIRAAAESALVDMTDRVEQMAQNDPSPTVRQLAGYYLQHRGASRLGGVQAVGKD